MYIYIYMYITAIQFHDFHIFTYIYILKCADFPYFGHVMFFTSAGTVQPRRRSSSPKLDSDSGGSAGLRSCSWTARNAGFLICLNGTCHLCMDSISR